MSTADWDGHSHIDPPRVIGILVAYAGFHVGVSTGVRVLVAGGTGFVGRRLVQALRAGGHQVDVMSRHPDQPSEVFGDVSDQASLSEPLDRVDAAFYLVHSLDRADFAEFDAAGARAFAREAVARNVGRVVYLGGLGDDDDDLSAHLRSRREVEQILSAAVPTVSLRAGIVVGDESVAWETLCQLVMRLPVMVTPRWVNTRTQPIALSDVVEFLVAALDENVPPGHYDIGAPDDTSYLEMMRTVAREEDHTLFVVPVPVLTPAGVVVVVGVDHRRRRANRTKPRWFDDQHRPRPRASPRAAHRPPSNDVPTGGTHRTRRTTPATSQTCVTARTLPPGPGHFGSPVTGALSPTRRSGSRTAARLPAGEPAPCGAPTRGLSGAHARIGAIRNTPTGTPTVPVVPSGAVTSELQPTGSTSPSRRQEVLVVDHAGDQ